ncbi:pyridoxal-phosphate dependent enzyme, partial [Klebsiella pneumoniae]|uniref:pyridoxal-phosphate dependent enzyme n=1 Tax=Klebsiella pneumoniae TaxID=573 RepID=UPI003EE2614B
MRKPVNNVLEAIGDTPIVRLNRMAKGLKPEIYVKLEFANPGGSIKDRIAPFIVEE